MMSIPFSVGKLLERAIARVRRLYLIRGLSVVGVVWLLAIAAVMVVDSRIVIFDDRIRYAMSAGALLLALLTSVFVLVIPLCRRLDFGRMARLIDARHPEFEERFSTLVELSASDPNKAGFSAALFGKVGELAEQDLGSVDLAHDFSAKAALRRLAVFAALALTLVVGIAVSPQLVGRLFVRAVAPWVDIGNLFANDIVVKPGDVVALSGTVIKIEAKGNEDSAVRLSSSTSPFFIRISRKTSLGWSAETVEAMPNGVYETTADPNEREWRYRVNAGPAVTRYYHMRVSMMPKYDLFLAKVTYPDYTGLQPLVVSNGDVGAIKAIEGSRVNFDLRVSDPDTIADFKIGNEKVFEHVMVSNKTVNWSLDLVNRDGFRAEKGSHPLTSFIDQPPAVVIEKPTGTLRLPPHAKIPVEITANDDIGLAEAYFRVSIDGEPWTRHFGSKIPLTPNPSTLNPAFVRTMAEVDLSLYDLIFAKNIRFDVVVSDACPAELGGPHSATSMPFTVQFAANEASWELQELKSEVTQAQRDLDEARKRLNDAQNLARQVRDTLRREQKVSENTEKQSERLAHELTQAEKRIEELRDDFLADERFAPLTRPLDRMLEETLKPALEAIEQASFRERNERAEAVDDVLPEMEKARQEVDDFAKQLEDRAKKVDAFEKAKDLAARQEALAKAAEEITSERPLDTAKLEAWKRLEEAAMQKADELARQNPDSDFSEAKRKMETAAREMAALKRELDAQKAEGERMKREADAAKAAAERKFGLQAQELAQAAADQQRAAEALAQTNLASAAQSQQAAERHLKNAESLPAVKALQDLAAEATKLAKESQQSNNPNNRTVEQSQELQRAAAEATKAEQALREALANPTNKVDAQALEDLDQKLRAELPKQQAALDAAKAERDQAKLEAQAAEAAKKREAEQAKLTDDQKKKQAQALAAAAADQKKAAEELAKGKPQNAAAAQRSAENNLKQGGATEGTKALQEAAEKAAEAAAKSAAQRPDQPQTSNVKPQTSNLPTLKNAQAAQQAAAEALNKERELREAMAKGEKTADDLAALDRANREAAAAAEQKLAAAQAADKVADLATAAKAQAEAQQALDEVAATRAEVAKKRRSGDKPLDQKHQSALAEKTKAAAKAAKAANEAQKAVEDLLKRGDATEGTKAMQQVADKAAAASQKAPHDVGRAERAAAAQRAAAQALQEEKALREAMAAGEKTAADLEALDRATQAAAKAAEDAFDKAEKEAAEADQLAGRQNDAQSRELAAAANDQQRAVTAMKQAAQKRAEEAKFRAAKNTNAAEARAREAQNLERQAAEAQRAAEDRLERGEATDAVKAMQQMATTAARNARKAPQTKEKFDLAAAAQQAATEALKNELKVREGMRKGEMTEDDLAALDEQLKEGLIQMAGQRTQSARTAAEAAVQKAKEAIGSEDEPEVSRLADAALDAVRDAVSSALSESKLEGNDQRAAELRNVEDALDAVDAETSEAEALENRILGLQQSAKEALERNDRNRAANLQKEIARAQARATDAVDGEDEVAARSAANAAQEKAAEALAKADQNWNNETRAAAVAAQQAAIDAEREAQSEARAVRAMDKLAAAEKTAASEAAVNRPDQMTSPSSEPAEAGDVQAASEAAVEASDAMDREVSAQAAALGMSKKSSSNQNQQGAGKEKGDEENKGGGGGGVSEEVKKLAKELQRKDNPDFFKNLFARLGWFKIRDISKDGLGARDLKDVPREYRDLVRRYFLKLSEENPSSEGR